MEFTWLVAGVGFCAVLATVVLMYRLARIRAELVHLARQSAELDKQLASSTTYAKTLEEMSEGLKAENQALHAESRQQTEQRSAAVTRAAELELNLRTLREERDAAVIARDHAIQQRDDAIRQTELAHLRVEETERRMRDWETTRQESIATAKAAILEAGGQMSNKLLEDHKRETEASRKLSEEQTKLTTEQLMQRFETVVKNVSVLDNQVQQTQRVSQLVLKALSSPTEGGQFAEIGLENTLKSFGLEPGRDYVLQYHVPGETTASRLRPDAVIFLPGDTLLVIDSKASKFVLELASAEDATQETEALSRLRKTMRDHLKSLASKDYRSAIQDAFKKAGRSGEIRRILTTMYLPNDAVIEKIQRADAEFQSLALQQDIIPAGPTGLAGLIAFSRIEIDAARQAENQQKIVDAVQGLLESLATALGHADKMGRGIQTAANSFTAFAQSVNSRLLPRARSVQKHGLRSTTNKALPHQLASYHVIAAETEVIQGEVEVLGEALAENENEQSTSALALQPEVTAE